jgi:hypothetical protein
MVKMTRPLARLTNVLSVLMAASYWFFAY